MALKNLISPERLKQLTPYLQKALPVIKNKYFIISFAFMLWVSFFDQYSLFSQRKLKQELRKLEDEKEFYLAEIEKLKEVNKELFTDSASLEKFAREKYLMKKDKEEIFLIVRK